MILLVISWVILVCCFQAPDDATLIRVKCEEFAFKNETFTIIFKQTAYPLYKTRATIT